MAYHFRKLRKTLRLIPSTKTIGFSTRFNEGDQTKNTCADSSTSSLSSGNATNSACYSDVVNDVTKSQQNSPLYRSLSDTDLLSTCSCNNSLPISYEDVVQIFLPKPLSRTDSIDGAAESNKIHGITSHTLSSLLRSVKAVHLTNDDIVAQPCSTSTDFDTGAHSTTNSQTATADFSPSFCSERIPVSILSENYRRRHSQTCFAADPIFSDNHRSCLDDIILGNRGINTFSSPEISENSTTAGTNPVYYSSTEGSGPSGNDKSRGPSQEQLHDIRPRLERLVTRLFSGRHDYGVLHKNVVMENNLFGDNKSCVGVLAYAVELMKTRLRIHSRYSDTAVEIMSVTTLENNGVIRIHWRLKGLPQVQVLKFWRIFQSRESVSKDDWQWLEAFSYFHIGKDGLVHKHRIDRMMPDNDAETDKLTDKLRGLLHQPKPLVS